jgi:hypothetical protein
MKRQRKLDQLSLEAAVSPTVSRQTINLSSWSDERIEAAIRSWDEYQKAHDVTELKGQAAGIDPETGDVWFGADITDIVKQREAQGLSSPLFFVRVGYPTYYRKGRRRRELTLRSSTVMGRPR